MKPWAGLARLRPARMESISRAILNFERLHLAVRLLQKFFPGIIREEYRNLRNVTWYSVLSHLIFAAEADDWFPVNWGALRDAWHFWQEKGDHGDHLAVWLKYIPVNMYGLTAKNIHEFPPMNLLCGLLTDNPERRNISADLLVQAEIYDVLDEWGHVSRQRAWDTLHQIEAAPLSYPEPVRHLPELAHWACARTRNPLLDYHFDPYSLARGGGPQNDTHWFEWETDMPMIRSAWVRAKPSLDAFHRLMDWSAQPENLARLGHYITTGESYEHLNW